MNKLDWQEDSKIKPALNAIVAFTIAMAAWLSPTLSTASSAGGATLSQILSSDVSLTGVLGQGPTGLALSVGQAATLLSDGTWLVSGGSSGRSSVSTQLLAFSPSNGRLVALAAHLQIARAAHTATLLADGTVFIHGGVDAHGVAIQQSEIFDPVTGQHTVLGSTGLLPRAHHAAAVLSDGRILITGGVDPRDNPVLNAEIYNPVTAQVDVSGAGVDVPRLDATAFMLPNGEILVSGGVDAQGKSLAASSLYDPVAQSFTSVGATAAQALATPLVASSTTPSVATSLPAANAVDVGVGAQLMVRFSTRLNVATLNSATVTLIGPGGTTPLKAIDVDSGVLLFVTPSQQLLPATQYTLFIQGAQDNAKRTLPMFSVGFTTQTIQAANNASATSTVKASDTTNQTSTNGAVTHAQSALSGIDEEWVPEERHRHGAWLSHRAYLAHSSLPQQPQLRQLIQSRTPTVPDAAALVTAHAVSEQSPRVPLASWHDVDVMTKAQNITAAANAAPGTGTTALSGQVLRLNGLPLAHVAMQVGTVTTFTDAHGEFTLSGIPSGNQVITINAATANRADATYGRFQYLFNVVAGKTNLLPFTVWMPKLDIRHAVHISSPTQQDTVISNPTMPGLSITLPAGTVVRDVDGKIVTEVSLTPIPADQPPYPMPYAGVPLHYTIQPGGAVIQSVDGKPKGAVVRYPNYTSFGPGTQMQLFDYDAKGRGWYVYSKAKVAANGTDITSDRDFLIYQFGTTSFSSGGPPPEAPPPETCSAPPPDSPPNGGGGWGGGDSNAGDSSSACGGDPVDLQQGFFAHTERDLFLPDVIPIDFTRTYRQFKQPVVSGGQMIINGVVGGFGYNTNTPYESYLVFEDDGRRIDMVMGDGSVEHFDNNFADPYSYDLLGYQNQDSQGSYRAAYIQRDLQNSTFIVTFKDGRHWSYSAFSARLTWIEDRVGNRLTLSRPNVNSYVTRVTSPNGRTVDVTYSTSNVISNLTDNLGRQYTYTYTGSPSLLSTATDPNGKVRRYGWDANDFLIQVTDPEGRILVKNTMEYAVASPYLVGTCSPPPTTPLPTGRVASQQLADGSTFSYTYNTTFATGNVNGGVDACSSEIVVYPSTVTQVTDRRNTVRKVEMDAQGHVLRNTAALGKPEQQITTSTYDPTTQLLSSTTDALNRQTAYTYDANGNVLTVTRLAGTSGAVTASATYDPVFNQPRTLTDANGHVTTLGYDTLGNLAVIKSALTQYTYLSYDQQGRLASVTNPLSKKTSFGYSGADLSSVKDPLSRQTQFLTDAVGRVMTQIDGLGNRTYQSWDSLNRLTQITDALGGLTKFTYDGDGNVLTQTDANNHTTTFAYNSIGQVQSMKDALLNSETSLYEPGGRLKQRTDRKGQVSGVTYDNLGRVATIGFGATAASPTAYTSTATLTWDAGNRLTKIVDVQGGKTTTITRTFDGLDRMTSEVTEQGEVDYAYDNGGRRIGMTVKNGPATARVVAQSVTYAYNVVDQITKIVQAAGPLNNNAAQTITFGYDNAGRLTSRTQPTGVIGYSYTDADELASITYHRPDNTVIATGTYTYDAAGHRTSVSGDLATFVQASGTDVTDAAYNVNNQLTKWRGKTFVYDKNGSLTSDGVNTYAWDARGQLAGVTGGMTATFQYDTQRRRLAKTIGGMTTAYAYDGDNFVQELAGLGNASAVNANLLTAGVDQLLARGTGTGATATLHWVMPEANNSTVILADSTGAIQKTYAYDPYGNTVPGAGTDTNSQQYTGRENDGGGLYFYRNRYYMSGCNRFISEDPIGWASGQTNNYAYVGGDPISDTDPSGFGGVSSAIGKAAGYGILGGIGNVTGTFISNAQNGGCSSASYKAAFTNGFVGGALGSLVKSPAGAGAVTAGVTEALNEIGLKAALQGNFSELDAKSIVAATVVGAAAGKAAGAGVELAYPLATPAGQTAVANMLGIPLGAGTGAGAAAGLNFFTGASASCPR